MNKPKDASKPLFISAVALSAIACVYCLFTDIKQTAENIIEAEPVSQFVQEHQESINIITDFVGLVGNSFDKVKFDLPSEPDSPDAQPTAPGTLIEVVNGDTYILNIEGKETEVQLIGVDAAESGNEVLNIVKERIHIGDTLYLEPITSSTENTNTLAYVYFSDGVLMQDWMLQNGYAKTTNTINHKYIAHFAELEQTAADKHIGIWNKEN